jgi:hypothetical protein
LTATDIKSLISLANPYQGLTGDLADWVIIYLMASWNNGL